MGNTKPEFFTREHEYLYDKNPKTCLINIRDWNTIRKYIKKIKCNFYIIDLIAPALFGATVSIGITLLTVETNDISKYVMIFSGILCLLFCIILFFIGKRIKKTNEIEVGSVDDFMEEIEKEFSQ